MRSLNRATLLGNVGQEPKIVEVGTQRVKKSSLSLATSERYTNKNTGEITETTQWHNLEAWGKTAELIEKYVSKGSKLYVEGKIMTDVYEKDGVNHYKTFIRISDFTILNKKTSQSQGAAQPSQSPDSIHTERPEAEDDLPF